MMCVRCFWAVTVHGCRSPQRADSRNGYGTRERSRPRPDVVTKFCAWGLENRWCVASTGPVVSPGIDPSRADVIH